MARTTQKELRGILDKALKKIKPGEKYFHYKSPDKFYIIKEIALLEDSEEPAVVYYSQYGENIIWVRSLEDFFAEKDVNGQVATRFTKVED